MNFLKENCEQNQRLLVILRGKYYLIMVYMYFFKKINFFGQA